MRVRVREASVEKHLVDGLDKLGYPCVKFIPDNRRGMPDRVVLLPFGRVVWIELKTTGGVLSEIQKYRHSELRKLGQEVEVVWTIEQADKLIGKIKSTYQPG